jgi:hypothetical protein
VSQLSVNTITNAAGGNTAQINGMTPTADSLQGFRNRIINGDMRIDQRNAGASVDLSGASFAYAVDRFAGYKQTAGASGTAQRTVVAPDGFNNSFAITVSTGATATGGEQNFIQHGIEGFNVADLGWGTAAAKAVTISFWVRSSLAGTYGFGVTNSAANRAYVASYTISAANTWEYKTVTIPGDTVGTWLTDNGMGIRLRFDYGSGPSVRITAGVWGSTFGNTVSAQANLVGTSGATFYITGVQLEAGSVATPFERRPYGTELALCQRYAQLNTAAAGKANTGGGAGAFYVPMMVQMRAAPTVTLVTGTGRVDQIYTSQRPVTSVNNIFGNDTAGTAFSVELIVTSLGANSQCTLFGGTLLMSSEL